MSNVIQGSFGVSEADKETLGGIYHAAKVPAAGDESFEDRFNALSCYVLEERRLLEKAYIELGYWLQEKARVFYSNGQTDELLSEMVKVRKLIENIELHVMGLKNE